MSSGGDLVPVLEIGGTHVTSALVATGAAQPVVTARYRVGLETDGTAECLIGSFGVAAGLLAAYSCRTEWGVAIPGPFDYDTGIGRFAGVGKFDALNGVDVGSALAEVVGARLTGVRFVNDATAFALGESAAGAARGHRRVVGLTLGTGIGSAFVADGEAVTDGPTVPPNGWVYPLRWDGRPLEDTVSRRAIRAAYRVAAGADLDVREIALLARAGEPAATGVLGHAMAVLGTVVGPWVRAFGASAVVVGGSIAGSWDLIGPPLTRALDAGGVEVVHASLGQDAGPIGAASAVAGGAPVAR